MPACGSPIARGRYHHAVGREPVSIPPPAPPHNPRPEEFSPWLQATSAARGS
jgi:hypothetical protein